MKKAEVVEAKKFEINANSDVLSMLLEELKGLPSPTFSRIKVPSGGSTAFEVPGLDEETEFEKELEGIILYRHAVNAYWDGNYEGTRDKPKCSSMDGIRGVSSEGELNQCADCPNNQFGPDGEGKACKNMNRLYLLQSGEILPIMITLPPSSLRNITQYVTNVVTKKYKPISRVITKITLKKESNRNGIEYAKAFFNYVDDVPEDMIPALEEYSKQILAIASTVEVANDEYNIPEASKETVSDDLPA